MARRQLIKPLLILTCIVEVRVAAAFQSCRTSHHAVVPRLRRRRCGCVLYATEEDHDSSRSRLLGEQDVQTNRNTYKRKGLNLRRVAHKESRITGAGAESLFSRSVWSFRFRRTTYTQTIKAGSSLIANDIQLASQADLPSIDCKWACTSDEEQVKVQQMKALLDDELQRIYNHQLHKTYPDVYSDLRLLRFLRKSEERDVLSAAARYKSFLGWRMENRVDDIRAVVVEEGQDEVEDSTTTSSFDPSDERLQMVSTFFPMKFDHVTQPATTDAINKEAKASPKGSTCGPFQPAAILYIGLFDTKGISEQIKAKSSSSISLDDFLNYWIYLYESIHYNLHQQSTHYGRMIFLDEVCDLSGLSIQQFSPYFVTKVMKPWLQMTQASYPETTRRIYVLNPPGIINLAWKLVTPLLSQGTVDKIRFVKKFDGTADEFCKRNDE